MTIESAKSSLKILGILSLILGIFGLILGAAFFTGGKILGLEVVQTTTSGSSEAQAGMALVGLMLIVAIITIVSALVDILLGVFSIVGSNKTEKIIPAYYLSLVAVLITIVSLVLTIFTNPTISSILDSIISLLFNGLIFRCAKTIKIYNDNPAQMQPAAEPAPAQEPEEKPAEETATAPAEEAAATTAAETAQEKPAEAQTETKA